MIAKILQLFLQRRFGVNLRTFALIVSAHPSAHANSHVMHKRALSYKMNKSDRADDHCYSFSWIFGRTATSVFLLMDHFLYQFSAFSEKIKKICQLEVSIFFAKCNWRSNSVLFSSSFIGATVSNAFWRMKFCENVGNICVTEVTRSRVPITFNNLYTRTVLHINRKIEKISNRK